MSEPPTDGAPPSPRKEARPASRAAPNRPPLFRQVAIDAAAGSQIGDPLDTYGRGLTLFTIAAIALVGALIAFLFLVEYSPIYRVPSYTDVRGGLVRLSAPVDARVRKIAVEEGASVSEGTLLAVLDTDRQTAVGDTRRAQTTQKLSIERDMIDREIAAARSEAQATHDLIDRRTAGLRAERDILRTDMRSVAQLLSSLRVQSEQVAAVASSGYATKMQLAQKRDEVTAQESRLASARAALARVERDIDTSEAEGHLADTKLAGIVENRERSKGELGRLTLQAESDAEQVILSPEAGTVSAALVARGQSVVSGQILFTLAPSGAPMIVRLVVPARAAASVRPGLDVKLVFKAYPQEKFGEFDARIERVSDTPLMPADLPQMYAGQGPAFIAVASIAPELRGPGGQVIMLKAGMLADALVPVERRRAIEWLLEPILRGFNDSAGRASESPAQASP
jgi:membrane fusion protein